MTSINVAVKQIFFFFKQVLANIWLHSLFLCFELRGLLRVWAHRWMLEAERRGAKPEKWRRMRSGCLGCSCSELEHVPPFAVPLQFRVLEYLGKTCMGRTWAFHMDRPELEMNPEPPAATCLSPHFIRRIQKRKKKNQLNLNISKCLKETQIWKRIPGPGWLRGNQGARRRPKRAQGE